ncbi:hypothetical protein [Virgibacillus necropolis]|uniref:hypothetical protein n=1 Tax=Virgibacillus necropolis TaxID=163877 RepID=UPI0014578BEC|nr:hypothetical protein [Virgibacillus necropolis]
MRYLDWQMILFVGSSLVHDYWIYWGLPQVHYWDVKHNSLKPVDEDNSEENKVA